MGKIFQVVVVGIKGQKFTIDLCNTEEQMRNMTVLQLKDKIAQRVPASADLRLIFADKMLEKDDTLLSDYGIQHMSVILTVVRVPGGGMAPLTP